LRGTGDSVTAGTPGGEEGLQWGGEQGPEGTPQKAKSPVLLWSAQTSAEAKTGGINDNTLRRERRERRRGRFRERKFAQASRTSRGAKKLRRLTQGGKG